MQFEIQGRGFPLTAPLLTHAERQLRLALSRASAQIRRVVVRLGDTNGPRGGEDKYCRMQVYLKNAPPVMIEGTGTEMYAVINRSAERASRNVVKVLDRQRRKARSRRPTTLPSEEASP